MDNNNVKFSRPVPPFVRYCSAIIPTMFDDSLSYYEALCALWKWLQTNLVDVVNNNAAVTEDYINLVKELEQYVHDYFGNLDVQEEINNKLDEMAESGELTAIIAQFLGLGALAVFNTEADMIASEQLIKGAKCKTLGKYTIEDGYGAYYSIDETGDIALDNGLYATLIENFGGNNYIDEITVQQIRKFDTDCYVFTIPKYTANGELIMPHVEYGDNESPLNHADSTFSTLTANASLTIKAPEGSGLSNAIPSIIGDGEIIRSHDDFVGSSLADNYMYLGIKADRSISEFKVNNTTAQNMIDAGVVQAFDVYYKLVEHGVASDLTNVVTNESTVVTNPNPRQCLGVKLDGTIIILTCDGRTGNDSGLTSAQTQEVLIELGCYDAWNLDGGGSTSSAYKGSKINRNIDNNRTTERNIPYTLNFRKEIIDEELAKAYSTIGREKQNTLEQVYESVVQNATTDISHLDLNNLTDKVYLAYGNGMDNKPIGTNGYFLNLPHSQSQYRNQYSLQKYYNRDTGRSYSRRIVSGSMTDWEVDNLYMRKVNLASVTISADNTYEDVEYGATQGYIRYTNDETGIISFTNDGGFKCNSKNRILVVRGMVTVTGGTAGKKYLELVDNGTRVESCFFDDYYSGSNNHVINFEFAVQTTLDHVYKIRFNGKAGDTIGKRFLILEVK